MLGEFSLFSSLLIFSPFGFKNLWDREQDCGYSFFFAFSLCEFNSFF
jgi:hypothetical protein